MTVHTCLSGLGQYGRLASFGRFSWTFKRFMPIWNPFMAWMAVWALAGLSKLTKPAKMWDTECLGCYFNSSLTSSKTQQSVVKQLKTYCTYATQRHLKDLGLRHFCYFFYKQQWSQILSIYAEILIEIINKKYEKKQFVYQTKSHQYLLISVADLTADGGNTLIEIRKKDRKIKERKKW